MQSLSYLVMPKLRVGTLPVYYQAQVSTPLYTWLIRVQNEFCSVNLGLHTPK